MNECDARDAVSTGTAETNATSSEVRTFGELTGLCQWGTYRLDSFCLLPEPACMASLLAASLTATYGCSMHNQACKQASLHVT